MTQYLVNILILVSQALNVLIGGSPYEMFCSRCWRLRSQPVWNMFRRFFDEVAWPLCTWRYEGMTHCESCFFDERCRNRECGRFKSQRELEQ